MKREVRILGCGSSSGVPRVAGGWGVCDPGNPRNRRRRCSILIEQSGPEGATRVLVDTGADLREQLLDAGVSEIDAVVYTHAHADHLNGIDDVRSMVQESGALLDAWMDAPTAAVVLRAFSYIFATPPGSLYPPLLRERRIEPGQPIVIDGRGGAIELAPFRLDHGEMEALGFRFWDIAYTPDLVRIPEESLAALDGLDLWIIDALRYRPHPTHFCIADALEWIERKRPRRAILTNLSSEVDYESLRQTLTGGIEPAYDGLTIRL